MRDAISLDSPYAPEMYEYKHETERCKQGYFDFSNRRRLRTRRRDYCRTRLTQLKIKIKGWQNNSGLLLTAKLSIHI